MNWLLNSLYVANVVVSLDNEQELKQFISEARNVMKDDNNINNLTALLAACPSTNSIHATSPARISTWSPLYMDVMGNDVTLPCRAVGNPRPAIYWLDGDNELIAENEPRYKVLPDGDLFIYKLQWSDMGGYTCIASNTRSRDMTTTFLYPVLGIAP
uniref:Ig-like domain-containing protein n=1 Tax=Timema cristinae TaxID=61476 RepID=A0A7R9H046_TIMCR|nr:unnamed protein product [Timema cristinae]